MSSFIMEIVRCYKRTVHIDLITIPTKAFDVSTSKKILTMCTFDNIYVVSSPLYRKDRIFKIGLTSHSIQTRLQELNQYAATEETTLSCEKFYQHVQCGSLLEKVLHREFNHQKTLLKREWFILTEDDLKKIDSLVQEWREKHSEEQCTCARGKKKRAIKRRNTEIEIMTSLIQLSPIDLVQGTPSPERVRLLKQLKEAKKNKEDLNYNWEKNKIFF